MALSVTESTVLAEFKRALHSRARAEGDESSDLDVLVVVRGLTKQERREIIDVAYDRELASGLVIAPLVREAAAIGSLPRGLASEIARDGVAL